MAGIYKKKTLSVGIPVFNEGANIATLITSILEQNHNNYILEKIVVACDGSTDNTPEIIKDLSSKNAKISLYYHMKREGKTKRLEDIYKGNHSELIMTLDGDTILGNKNVLDTVASLFTDSTVVIVGANALPFKGSNFIEKLINTWSRCWYEARREYKGGNNIFNVLSCSLCLRRDFAKTITFPKGTTSDGQFIYLSAVVNNLKFRFSKNAVVYFRSEATFSDYLRRLSRFSNDRKIQIQTFGEDITKEFEFPTPRKLKGIYDVFKKEPLITIAAIFFHHTTLFISHKKPGKKIRSGFWEVISSTKKPVLQIRLNQNSM